MVTVDRYVVYVDPNGWGIGCDLVTDDVDGNPSPIQIDGAETNHDPAKWVSDPDGRSIDAPRFALVVEMQDAAETHAGHVLDWDYRRNGQDGIICEAQGETPVTTFWCKRCRNWTPARLGAGWPRCATCYEMYGCGDCGNPIHEDGTCTRPGCTQSEQPAFAPPDGDDVVIRRYGTGWVVNSGDALYFTTEAEALTYIGAF